MAVTRSKILFLDIETAPKLSYHWKVWQENIAPNQIVQDTYVLTWCAKWADSSKMYSDALFKHPRYKVDPTCDKSILKTIHRLLDEADIVVAHNGARFDIPVLNARFVSHGMRPPSVFRVVDTLQIARRQFNFTSNRLDELGKQLKLGRKIDTGGMQLWLDIVQNRKLSAFKKMLAYNAQDVLLLEAVYNRMKGWDTKHPATVMIKNPNDPHCNVCGSNHICKNGSYMTSTQEYQKYQCQDCGHSMRARKAIGKTNALQSV